jgi:hypothetical protein
LPVADVGAKAPQQYSKSASEPSHFSSA